MPNYNNPNTRPVPNPGYPTPNYSNPNYNPNNNPNYNNPINNPNYRPGISPNPNYPNPNNNPNNNPNYNNPNNNPNYRPGFSPSYPNNNPNYNNPNNTQPGGVQALVNGVPYTYTGPFRLECYLSNGSLFRQDSCNNPTSCLALITNYRQCRGTVKKFAI